MTRQSRWQSYFKVYKKTKARLDTQTGFCLTTNEIQKGKTLEQAVDEACPYFYRLDELFGERQNVHTHSVLDSEQISLVVDLAARPEAAEIAPAGSATSSTPDWEGTRRSDPEPAPPTHPTAASNGADGASRAKDAGNKKRRKRKSETSPAHFETTQTD